VIAPVVAIRSRPRPARCGYDIRVIYLIHMKGRSLMTLRQTTTSIRSSRALLISALTALAAFASFPSKVVAQEKPSSGFYIKVGEANLKKSPLAIPPFQFTGSPAVAKDSIRLGKDLYDVFYHDMFASGYFDMMKQDAFLEDTSKVGLKPASQEAGGFNFSSWKQIKADFLVRVGFHVTGDQLTADTYVYYVPQEKTVLSKTYRAKPGDVRTLAHTFANDVVKELTGKKGFFLSKIVTSRTTQPGQKEIFVLDWDGANSRQISSHKTIAQSPTWSWDGKTIAYSAFAYHVKEKSRNLDLFTYELASGRRFLVSYKNGINSGASFTPDDRHLLLTVSSSGNPDIYRMTVDGKSLERLTNGPGGAMNVEPAMSPDGKKIAFSSTRSGKPMIFTMDSSGGGVKRLTEAGVYNSTPAWSPDGTRIAFAGFDTNHFDIFIMDADGTHMSRLTMAKRNDGKMANNEDPTFSPDGRHILFRSDRTGKYQLYMVSVDGQDEIQLTKDQFDYFKPRWSPFLD
jgi:TolB protein